MALALTIFAIVLASLALGVQVADLRAAGEMPDLRAADQPLGLVAANDNAIETVFGKLARQTRALMIWAIRDEA